MGHRLKQCPGDPLAECSLLTTTPPLRSSERQAPSWAAQKNGRPDGFCFDFAPDQVGSQEGEALAPLHRHTAPWCCCLEWARGKRGFQSTISATAHQPQRGRGWEMALEPSTTHPHPHLTTPMPCLGRRRSRAVQRSLAPTRGASPSPCSLLPGGAWGPSRALVSL